MKTVLDIPDLKNKKVLLRTDFDVPLSDRGEVEEDFRIKKQKEMLDWLVERGAKVVILSHISATNSFEPVLSQIQDILGHKLNFVRFKNSDIKELIRNLKLEIGNLILLDNIRQFSEEKKNDENFARALADDFDIYINNAFAVCHRAHASVSAITEFLPSYAGFLVSEEATQLQKATDAPKEGKVIIMGGAKAKTKAPVIKNFLDKSDKILLGGVVANDFMKAKGMDIKDSVADDNVDELLKGIDLNSPQIIIPEDFNWMDNKIYGLGPRTIAKYVDYIQNAKMVIWNGPVGVFENPRFRAGTTAIAESLAEGDMLKILGGGDTVAAVNSLELLDKFDFISTGGGAMLMFLAAQRLPGLEVLGYYN